MHGLRPNILGKVEETFAGKGNPVIVEGEVEQPKQILWEDVFQLVQTCLLHETANTEAVAVVAELEDIKDTVFQSKGVWLCACLQEQYEDGLQVEQHI